MNNQFGIVVLSLIISAVLIFIFKMAFKAFEEKDRTLNLLVISVMIMLWLAMAYSFYLARIVIVSPTATRL